MRSLILFAVAALALSAVAAGEEKKIVCYLSSWSVYRPDAGQFLIEDINPEQCTHLIYAFVGLDGDNVKILDEWQDLPKDGGKDGLRRFNALREKSPGTKTLVAIGGWKEGSTTYSNMASDPSSRARFVKNVVAFVKKHNFDGFDVDWEYPAQRGGASSDVKNFVALLKELREAFDNAGGLILSAAVGVAESTASQSYDIAAMSKSLDFINLMTYDFHPAAEPQTGMNAPLYAASVEVGAAKQLNVDAAVKYWLSKGAPKNKLILGTATYGRSFTLADPNAAKVGDASTRAGSPGPYTNEAGMLGYNEICEKQKNEQWTVKFDEERRVPFAYKDNQWVSYDNVQSIKEKAEYIKKMGLGGGMVWSIETDDFRGLCGDKFPLLGTLNHVLRNGKPVSVNAPQPPQAIDSRAPETTNPSQNDNQNSRSDNDSNDSGECTTVGAIPDPETCKQFYQCVATLDGFQKIAMECPVGLCYNKAIGVCDWE